jgi:hypothetical protein
MGAMPLSWCRAALSQPCVIVNCAEILVWSAECFPAWNFVKIYLPKSTWCPKSKVNVNMLNWSDKVTIWDSLRGGKFLVTFFGVKGKWTELPLYGTELTAPWACTLPPQQLSPGTICLQIPRVYCMVSTSEGNETRQILEACVSTLHSMQQS